MKRAEQWLLLRVHSGWLRTTEASCDCRSSYSVIHMEVRAGLKSDALLSIRVVSVCHCRIFLLAQWHMQRWEGPPVSRWHWQYSFAQLMQEASPGPNWPTWAAFSFWLAILMATSCQSSPLTPSRLLRLQSKINLWQNIPPFQTLSQVVDGFFVKRVQDVRESAAYLTVMTRYLTKLYQVCVLSTGPRSQRQTAVCLICFKLNFFFFPGNLNCRTARWPVAPESWRVTERKRCRAPRPPLALSSRLQNSTTVPSKTRSAFPLMVKSLDSMQLLSLKATQLSMSTHGIILETKCQIT